MLTIVANNKNTTNIPLKKGVLTFSTHIEPFREVVFVDLMRTNNFNGGESLKIIKKNMKVKVL